MAENPKVLLLNQRRGTFSSTDGGNLLYCLKVRSHALCRQPIRYDWSSQTLSQQVFFQVQKRLRAMNIAFIPIENDLELYVFEVYAAMALDTGTWNTFRTH